MKLVKNNYYAFYSVEGSISSKTPLRYSSLMPGIRDLRREVLVHLTEKGNARWSIHLPSGKAVAAGGWKNGVRYRISDAELHLYDKPEIE